MCIACGLCTHCAACQHANRAVHYWAPVRSMLARVHHSDSPQHVADYVGCCLSQLRKIKDLPRILQRLRLTQGLLDSRDFQSMLDRCPLMTFPYLPLRLRPAYCPTSHQRSSRRSDSFLRLSGMHPT